MSTILDVNVAAFESETHRKQQSVAEQTMQSLETGFVYADHTISNDLLDTAYEMLGQFFASTQSEKDSVIARGSNGQTGYTPVMVETAVSSELADWKEMLNWGTQLPKHHPLRRRYPNRYVDAVLPEHIVPGIGQVLYELHHALVDLQRRFLRIVALGIGCDPSFFDGMTRYGSSLSRAIHYPPMEHAPNFDGISPVWAAEHGDINLVTALPRASGRGLQVKTSQGWIDAQPPEGHAILNTGIMLEHLTNGRIPTGIHRVVADPEQQDGRLSVVQFMHPSPATILTPATSCIEQSRPQRFGAISADDLLNQVLYDINLRE